MFLTLNILSRILSYFIIVILFLKKIYVVWDMLKSSLVTIIQSYILLGLIFFKQSFMLLDLLLVNITTNCNMQKLFLTFDLFGNTYFFAKFSIKFLLLIFIFNNIGLLYIFVQPALYVKSFLRNLAIILSTLFVFSSFNYYYFFDFLAVRIHYLCKYQSTIEKSASVFYTDLSLPYLIDIGISSFLTFNFYLMLPHFLVYYVVIFEKTYESVFGMLFQTKWLILYILMLVLLSIYIFVAKYVAFFSVLYLIYFLFIDNLLCYMLLRSPVFFLE